jgi:hypothetical protein
MLRIKSPINAEIFSYKLTWARKRKMYLDSIRLRTTDGRIGSLLLSELTMCQTAQNWFQRTARRAAALLLASLSITRFLVNLGNEPAPVGSRASIEESDSNRRQITYWRVKSEHSPDKTHCNLSYCPHLVI